MKNLKELREEKMTMQEIADKIGITRERYGVIEKNIGSVALKRVAEIAGIIGCRLSDIKVDGIDDGRVSAVSDVKYELKMLRAREKKRIIDVIEGMDIGLSRYHYIEKDPSRVSFKAMIEIANAIGCSIDEVKVED